MTRKISPASRIAIIYFIVSALWVLGSDELASIIAGKNVELYHTLQKLKGIFFICISSLFLFWVANIYYRKMSLTLARSEELLDRYKALGEASREGIADHDLITDIANINDKMKVYLELDQDVVEHFSIKYRQRIHPDDRPTVVRNFRETVASGASLWQGDFRCKLTNGTYHDVKNRGTILRDENGRATRFIFILQDVSELRNMRTAFYEQQIRHKQLVGQSIIKAQESERNRWAEELHDNVGQLLTVVKLYLDQLAAQQQPSPSLVTKSQEMTVKALNDIRHLSASIKPPEFSISTLEQSIENLLENIARIRPYEFNLDMEQLDENQLKDDQKLMIYRVVQEQLNNIIKYANASFIDIVIRSSELNVQIEIKDNGQGFDTTKRETGIGLRNIRSRLQVYSGSLIIESSPGKGCVLIAGFSLSAIPEDSIKLSVENGEESGLF
jgi:two-component system, NarL family, sensor histidine kinase UhpB